LQEPQPERSVRKVSAEIQQIGEEFADFLKSLCKPEAALDASKQLRFFIEKIQVSDSTWNDNPPFLQ
jgi:hypothetical protein